MAPGRFWVGLVDRQIAPHIPVFDKSGRNDGTWTRADFEWDAENDQYVCPEGHALKQFRRNYSDPNRGPTGRGTARYRALKEVCQACPSKAKCCPNADARKITREEHEDARQVARDIAKTRQYDISMEAPEEGRDALRAPSNASSGWDGSDCEAHAAQTMNSSSLPPPRTSGNWPSSFLHRQHPRKA